MRRLFVVVAVLSALVLQPAPAHAVGANVCTWQGQEVYDPVRLGLVPATGLRVVMHIDMSCLTTLSPILWGFNGEGVTHGSCAAEIGQAQLAGGNTSGQAAFLEARWARVGIHGVMTFVINTPGGPTSQWVLAGPMGWIPDNVANCVAPGVMIADILGYGPLVGV